MSIWRRVQKAFGNYLAHLEKENKELFGAGKPDCCSLNGKGTVKQHK